MFINVKGSLMDLSIPRVMGILNVTPDSFYNLSRAQTTKQIEDRVCEIIDEGASIIDIGAYSSRPGATHISTHEEMERLRKGLEIIQRLYPDAIVSIDTFRADVAKECVEHYGAAIINDISGGQMDERMFPTIASLGVPYILTHIQGTPQDMQLNPHYTHFPQEVFLYFAQKTQQLYDLGAKDIIIDPGFGFGKTLEHNYSLMACMGELRIFQLPILVGISRKSMIYKLLDVTPQEALTGTVVLNTVALLKGANILRVHDVREAVEAIKIIKAIQTSTELSNK